jgi:Co/Zn/Cd efflux system component
LNNLQKKKTFYGRKKKAAIISIALNILLTFFKFILYFFTGSITILAEAWHSFSDIATSFATFFAINEEDSTHKKVEKRFKLLFSFKGTEYAVSFYIGILMLFISFSILKEAFLAQVEIIRNPLLSGLSFFLFSLGSYIVYRFETDIGRKENSIALISDGMHSRADMVAALLAGFSLISYCFGLNVDRLFAIIIGLFIFSFSIETIINSLFAEKKSNTYQYRTINAVNFLLEVHNWKKIISYFEGKSHLKISPFLHVYRRTVIFSSLLLILILYFSSSFYMVEPSQQAIIERLGRVINEGSPVSPGLHIKLPWPFDSAIKIDYRSIRKINVGNVADEGSYALIWTKEHGTEEAFLSADNFLFYPYIVLHYRIKDIFAYQYHNEDPQRLLENLAHEAMVKIFVGKEFYEIAVLDRKQLVDELAQRIQSKLDKMSSGLESSICLSV